ncbi:MULTISPECIES: adenylate/guanylate cyclase domain-containing protein [unclassified Ruegeria]|uniref:adenylate/guanylate cyclase domain-containing protein n=1 Tax=unclassified Ruegeria TaxID=2625375 RepID=UPI001489BA81|nr:MULTISPECIES: adenylate/guanylate cyclase domain-containing protein [unclassified Ruegeria]NOD64757.1 AAA family ATPase [Ruegeria sp. HKCCD6109]
MSPIVPSLSSWLEQAGLGKYADIMKKAAIEPDMIGELTDADFIELGIPIGDRLRFRRHYRASFETKSDNAPVRGLDTSTETMTEHRQITVLFSDLVGWTALSNTFDSEDLSEAISECRALWTAAVERYDGFVAFRLGDGMMAFFGHPHAYEDGAERAIHAGLDIVKAIEKYSEDSNLEISRRLAVRVGIATGKVLLNKKTTGKSEDIDILGFTPNFAARLQGAAQPNSVFVSSTTASLAWQRFNFQLHEGITLRGIEEPHKIYEVLGTVGSSERPSHHSREFPREIIGRAHEIGILNDLWATTVEGDGQIAIVSGEAGIGKSAITTALLTQSASVNAETVQMECRSYYTNSYLHPVMDYIATKAHITDADTDEKKLGKLYAFLSEKGIQDHQDRETIANMLFFDTHKDAPAAMSTERQKAESIRCLVKILLHSNDGRPKIILFEDAHWADPTSLELLHALAAEIPNHRAFLVITSRQDEIGEINRQKSVSSLRLNRLSRAQGIQIIRNWSPGMPISEQLEQQILHKSDGIPFFLEELTKTVCANMASDTGVKQGTFGQRDYVTIPATLYDSLLSRLDRSPEARKLVGCAAVIGREFSELLLSRISRVKRDEARRILAVLIDAGLLVAASDTVDGVFKFKHALVQDAIYDGLTRKARRELHARIGFVLENSSTESIKNSPEILAQHFGRANNTEKALRYWEAAGRRAMEHSATTEAISHFEQALALIDNKPSNQEKRRQKIELLTNYGAALTSVKGYTAPETVQAYEDAWQLTNSGEDKTCLHEILYGMWNSAQVGSDYARAQELADLCLDFAKQRDDEVSKLVARNLCGVTSTLRGDHRQAETHLSKSVEIYDPTRFQSLSIQTGEDPGVESLCFLSFNRWYMGRTKEAVEFADRSLELAKKIAYKQSIVYSLAMRGVLLHFSSEYDALIEVSDEIIEQSKRHNYPFFVEWSLNLKGWALAKKGHHDDGLALMSNTWQQGFCTLLEAKVHLETGEKNAGLDLVDDIITKQPWLSPEAQRVKGELLLLGSNQDRDGARSCFLDAFTLAEEQGASSLMLKTALSMADHASTQDPGWPDLVFLKRALAAVDTSNPTVDLKRAQKHLERLGGRSPNVA